MMFKGLYDCIGLVLREKSGLEVLDSYIFPSALRIFGTAILLHPSVSLPVAYLPSAWETIRVQRHSQ